MCFMSEECFEHFMSCITYGKVSCEVDWKEIVLNNVENHILSIDLSSKNVTFVTTHEIKSNCVSSPTEVPILNIQINAIDVSTVFRLFLLGIKRQNTQYVYYIITKPLNKSQNC